jgi:GSPII_E N-terminal domain.
MSDIEKRMLGELLIEKGLVTREQLAEGLALQEKSSDNLPIGEILVNMGYLADEGLALTLAKKLNIKYLSFEAGTLVIEYDQDLIKSVSEEFARNHTVLPISKTPKTIFITMWNPLDFTTIDNLRRMAAKDVVVCCSTKKIFWKVSKGFTSLRARQPMRIFMAHRSIRIKVFSRRLKMKRKGSS